ncbi:MAG: ribonuclease III domain-containing protein, partial [Bacillota bacterium]|jgi:ribonuclease-3 family protein|nr:Mini-ribonuclease 3 [Bacillota bacterium]
MAPGGSVYLSDEQVREVSPTVLAYVGDAVWELFVRTQLVAAARGITTAHDLHRAALRCVSARGQSRLVQELAHHLTPEEQDLVRRGRNVRPHHAVHSSETGQYRHSTGFETLLGHAYLTGRSERLDELLHMALEIVNEGCGDRREGSDG